MHQCAAKSELLIFQSFFSVYRAKLSDFAQRVFSLILWNKECKLVQNNGHIHGSHH